jgi:hypothetical protein
MVFRIVVCLLLFVAVPPVPGQTPDQSTDKSGNPKRDGGRQKQAARQIPTPLVLNPNAIPDTQRSRTEQKRSDNPVSISTIKPLDIRADVPKDWMDKLNWVFTAILLLIGAAGVCAAIRTLRAIEQQAGLMERQAKVMESQTALMRVPYHQWVELSDWKVNPIPQSDPIEKLRIRANLVNPTGFPITILDGKIIFGDPFGHPDLTSQIPWDIKPGSFLPPNTPHVIDVTVDLDQEAATQFTNGTFHIGVRAKFYHVGPLGEELKISQPLLGELVCGRSGAEFRPIVHMNPKAEENQTQNPS